MINWFKVFILKLEDFWFFSKSEDFWLPQSKCSKCGYIKPLPKRRGYILVEE